MKKSLLTLLMVVGVGATAWADTYWKADFEASRTTGWTLEDKGWTNIDVNSAGKIFELRQTNYEAIDGVKVDRWENSYHTAYLKGALSPADNWLITPSLRFEAGKTYKTTLMLAKTSFAEYPDIYEIKMGSAANAAAMTTTLVPLSGLPEGSGNTLWTKEISITVPTTGDYYIGIHCCGELSDYASFGVTEFEIEKGVAAVNPAAVTNLTVTPDPLGDKKATIAFHTPKLAKDGSTLTALEKVEIKRGSQVVHTFPNPAPDTDLSWTDTEIPTNGVYTYSVVAYSASGAGDIASASAFVGINVPAPAEQAVATATAPWSAFVSWFAPTQDKDGNPIAESLVSYDLYRAPLYSSFSGTDRVLLAPDLKATSFRDTMTPVAADPDDETVVPTPTREFYKYIVIAKTSTGAATETVSTPVMLGEAYAFPYYESWSKGRAANLFTSEGLEGKNTRWNPYTAFEDAVPQDNDNGYLVLSGAMGGWTVARMGQVSLKDAESPVLSFYTFNLTGCTPGDNELYVIVTGYDANGQVTTEVGNVFVPANGWHRQFVTLDQFKGQTVTVELYGHRVNTTYTFVDNFSISTIFPHDLKVLDVAAPADAKTDRPFELSVTVHNAGTETSGSYSVKLLANDVEVDSKSLSPLGVGLSEVVTFSQVLGIDSKEPITYTAEIVYADDDDPANNSSVLGTVAVVMPPYPVITDLTATLNDAHAAELKWGEPDTSTAKDYPITETWDSYPSWANENLGEWTLVDRDEALIAGFAGKEMPGIPSYSEQSWWVFDNSSSADFPPTVFEAWSANKFIASMVSGFNSDNDKGKPAGFVDCDDWAISPALAGSAQTVTVYARSLNEANGGMPESIEILYSDGSLSPDDFVSAAKYEEVGSSWTPYTAQLPDGARRFAIRNISNGKMLLMVDDVIFHGVANSADFAIEGYNVYRDGVRLNDAPVEALNFVDNSCGDGNHDYTVTVRYAVGESLHSNVANPTQSGIHAIDGNVGIRVIGRYDLQGRPATRDAAPGIYIERLSDGTARKVRRH